MLLFLNFRIFQWKQQGILRTEKGSRLDYSNLTVNPPGIIAGKEGFTVTLSVEVRNTGKQKGAEVVQVYVKDAECGIQRPNKDLKGFARVF